MQIGRLEIVIFAMYVIVVVPFVTVIVIIHSEDEHTGAVNEQPDNGYKDGFIKGDFNRLKKPNEALPRH